MKISQEHQLNLANLPADIVRNIIPAGLEMINSVRLVGGFFWFFSLTFPWSLLAFLNGISLSIPHSSKFMVPSLLLHALVTRDMMRRWLIFLQISPEWNDLSSDHLNRRTNRDSFPTIKYIRRTYDLTGTKSISIQMLSRYQSYFGSKTAQRERFSSITNGESENVSCAKFRDEI